MNNATDFKNIGPIISDSFLAIFRHPMYLIVCIITQCLLGLPAFFMGELLCDTIDYLVMHGFLAAFICIHQLLLAAGNKHATYSVALQLMLAKSWTIIKYFLITWAIMMFSFYSFIPIIILKPHIGNFTASLVTLPLIFASFFYCIKHLSLLFPIVLDEETLITDALGKGGMLLKKHTGCIIAIGICWIFYFAAARACTKILIINTEASPYTLPIIMFFSTSFFTVWLTLIQTRLYLKLKHLHKAEEPLQSNAPDQIETIAVEKPEKTDSLSNNQKEE